MDPLKPLWLSQKGATYDDTQKEQRIYSCQLLDLFRINAYQPLGIWDWGPTENEKKRLFLGKKFTLNGLFDAQRAFETVTLLKQFPFLHYPLESLYLHYDFWQGNTQTSMIATVQVRLDLLHSNFFALLDAVGEFSTQQLKQLTAFREMESEFDDLGKRTTAMTSLEDKETNSPILCAEELAQRLSPYFWKDTLISGTKEGFTYILKKQFEKTFSYEKPTDQNKYDLNPLPGMARLHAALREAKAQAASEKALHPMPLSIEESGQPHPNHVYALKNREKQTVAYLKDSKAFGAKTLEKLAWELACIFGVDASFNPTTTTGVHFHQIGFGEKHQPGWRIGHPSRYFDDIPSESNLKPPPRHLTLVPIDSPELVVQGSFQPAIEGHELARYLVGCSTVGALKTSKNQLILATLVTILFGMMDAHAKNIFVKNKTKEDDTTEGSLLFFDNPRIFPNGDVILAEDFLLCSYRSGLLELEDTYTSLSGNEKEFIKKKLVEFEEKIHLMENYLERKTWKLRSHEDEKKIRCAERKTLEEVLPAHWFDTKRIVQNTKDRLRRTREACEHATCLRDLVLAANPEFKWVAALHIAGFTELTTSKTIKQIQKLSLPSVGACPIQKVLQECQKKDIDPIAIKKACEDPNLSFEQLLDNLLKRAYLNVDQSQSLAEEALKLFIDKAIPDYKDRDITALTVSPERLAVLSKMTLLRFKNLGIPIIELKNMRKKFKDEDLETYLFELLQQQKELAKTFFSQQNKTYAVSPPVEDHTKFTLLYKEDGKGIQAVEIDFTSSPGNINLDDYTVPVLSISEFKKFCDDLPVSLRYRKKDEVSTPTQTWVVEFTPPGSSQSRITSIVVVDD